MTPRAPTGIAMNPNQLRALRAVQEHGSVNAAAASLRLSPSAISQQLQTLAGTCGFAVIERSGRGVRLTPRGLEMAELGDEILARWESAVDSLRRRAERPARTVRIGALPSAYRSWLFTVVHRLRSRTGMTFELFETAPHEAYDQVAAERLDLAVAVRVPGREISPLTSHPLYRDPFVLVAPPDIARSTVGSLRAFEDADWVLPGQETFCHEVIVGHCADLGFRPRAAARSNDWQVMQEMAALLQAVALVPSSCLTSTRGLVPVGLPATELPVWDIELATRAPVAATPWFTMIDREMSRLSPGQRRVGRERLAGIT
ncbi:LysR family transcriptional regulator [Streptomyces eurythermus]|uniref:LysR family transcriptional regulator n=1 Tax=Streptomyces eurythermus TaxID=42237 RepID=UPI0033C273F3